jgi:hypothetical protein
VHATVRPSTQCEWETTDRQVETKIEPRNLIFYGCALAGRGNGGVVFVKALKSPPHHHSLVYSIVVSTLDSEFKETSSNGAPPTAATLWRQLAVRSATALGATKPAVVL